MDKGIYQKALSLAITFASLLSPSFNLNTGGEKIWQKPVAAVVPAQPAFVAPEPAPVRPAAPKPVSVQTGVASWYTDGRTASGERYRASGMTAAHRRLPLGTYVRVTNLANNRSTVVRINDRGPYVRGRVLDLSVAAARQLAMIQSGVAKVRMEVLGSTPPAEMQM